MAIVKDKEGNVIGCNGLDLFNAKKRENKIKTDKDGNLILYKDYVITKDRIDTPEKIIAWIHHLSGKKWFDRHFTQEFIEACTSIANIDPHLPC